VLVFVEGGKTENQPGEKPRARLKPYNNLNPHGSRAESNMGHIGQRQALLPPHHLYSLKTKNWVNFGAAKTRKASCAC